MSSNNLGSLETENAWNTLRWKSSSFGVVKEGVADKNALKPGTIGVWSLSVLIFYSVSGGAFGIEDVVGAGGPTIALAGFVLLFVWAVPEALVTAELSTALPEASGSVSWVTMAFGPFWGFQKGWLSLLSGIADNSLYPILLLDSLDSLFSAMGEDIALTHGLTRVVTTITMVCFLTYFNYRGLDYVGTAAIYICVFSMLPFVVFCILGAFQVQPWRWGVMPPGGLKGVNWNLFLNTFFWNINYWDSAASYAGDVRNPGKNYPRGLFYGFIMVSLSAFLPVLIGIGASSMPYSEWTDGCFTALAVDIGGPWLGVWMMAAGVVTNIGNFEAEMSSDSCMVAGMADRGILPQFLGTRSEYGTPTYGILISATGIFFLSWFSFSEVVSMLNLLYCFAQLIEFAAFIELRRKHPDMPRPFKVPLGTVGVSAMLLIPVLFIFVMIGFSSAISIVLAGLMSVMGFAMAHILNVAHDEGWCYFENQFVDNSPNSVNPFVETKEKRELLELCLTNPVDHSILPELFPDSVASYGSIPSSRISKENLSAADKREISEASPLLP